MTADNPVALVLVFQGNDGIHQSVPRSCVACLSLPAVGIAGTDKKKKHRSAWHPHADIRRNIAPFFWNYEEILVCKVPFCSTSHRCIVEKGVLACDIPRRSNSTAQQKQSESLLLSSPALTFTCLHTISRKCCLQGWLQCTDTMQSGGGMEGGANLPPRLPVSPRL